MKKIFLIIISVVFIAIFSSELRAQTNSSIIIPNVFTPNRDGHNDIFVVEGVGITKLHVQIYNRWGELLYESHQLREGWNGRTTAAAIAPEGTYFYMVTVEAGGETTHYKGTLSLLR